MRPSFPCINTNCATPTSYISSGRHPFDYGVVPGDPDWPSSVLIQSHDCASQFWLSSAQNDNVVKRRIIDGEVDFFPGVWGKVPNGVCQPCLMPVSIDNPSFFPKPGISVLCVALTARALCESLLCPDPRARATVYQALDSKWIRRNLNELTTAYQKRMTSRS